MRNLREKTNWRKEFGHRLGLQVIVVDTVEDNVDNVNKQIGELGAITFDQQLDLSNKDFYYYYQYQK